MTGTYEDAADVCEESTADTTTPRVGIDVESCELVVADRREAADRPVSGIDRHERAWPIGGAERVALRAVFSAKAGEVRLRHQPAIADLPRTHVHLRDLVLVSNGRRPDLEHGDSVR